MTIVTDGSLYQSKAHFAIRIPAVCTPLFIFLWNRITSLNGSQLRLAVYSLRTFSPYGSNPATMVIVVPLPHGLFFMKPLQRYIDPDSICCVVLVLEDMNFRRESPVRRLVKAFFLPRKDRTNASASSKPASQLPKVNV